MKILKLKNRVIDIEDIAHRFNVIIEAIKEVEVKWKTSVENVIEKK